MLLSSYNLYLFAMLNSLLFWYKPPVAFLLVIYTSWLTYRRRKFNFHWACKDRSLKTPAISPTGLGVEKQKLEINRRDPENATGWSAGGEEWHSIVSIKKAQLANRGTQNRGKTKQDTYKKTVKCVYVWSYWEAFMERTMKPSPLLPPSPPDASVLASLRWS